MNELTEDAHRLLIQRLGRFEEGRTGDLWPLPDKGVQTAAYKLALIVSGIRIFDALASALREMLQKESLVDAGDTGGRLAEYRSSPPSEPGDPPLERVRKSLDVEVAALTSAPDEDRPQLVSHIADCFGVPRESAFAVVTVEEGRVDWVKCRRALIYYPHSRALHAALQSGIEGARKEGYSSLQNGTGVSTRARAITVNLEGNREEALKSILTSVCDAFAFGPPECMELFQRPGDPVRPEWGLLPTMTTVDPLQLGRALGRSVEHLWIHNGIRREFWMFKLPLPTCGERMGPDSFMTRHEQVLFGSWPEIILWNVAAQCIEDRAQRGTPAEDALLDRVQRTTSRLVRVAPVLA